MSRICNFSADFLHIHSSDGFSNSSTIVILNAKCKQHDKASRATLVFPYRLDWIGSAILFISVREEIAQTESGKADISNNLLKHQDPKLLECSSKNSFT
ncbi:hypothetical protein BHM03_00040900 [Ensete ventricosum]|uniref:Uncharacterized protein n=1 Tax=Ensete ventricosum TaxID=4639 RepID=A0A426Y6G3_ENSVE|nr:hypothetical protein B296_00039689 [Ensete ventricosum]RZS09780.1 hypothetical protein BHM03_00040900 [Ensete ventricosum]